MKNRKSNKEVLASWHPPCAAAPGKSWYYIYRIDDTETGKVYVGQHKYKLGETPRSYMGRGGVLLKEYARRGRSPFCKDILEWVQDTDGRDAVNERERWWIKELSAMADTYNVNPGGKNTCLPETAAKAAATRKAHGYRPTAATRAKMSEASRGKPKTAEHRKHLSEHHHLKTTHVIEFADGRPSVSTTDALAKIAPMYGVDATTLRRRSARGLYTGGIRLAEMYGKQLHDNNRLLRASIMCIDPVVGDLCTMGALYCRKNRDKIAYAGVSVRACKIGDKEDERAKQARSLQDAGHGSTDPVPAGK